jgi:hypothetical protein
VQPTEKAALELYSAMFARIATLDVLSLDASFFRGSRSTQQDAGAPPSRCGATNTPIRFIDRYVTPGEKRPRAPSMRRQDDQAIRKKA